MLAPNENVHFSQGRNALKVVRLINSATDRMTNTFKCTLYPGKLSSSHGLTGTRASSPQADRMSALPVSILELAQKVNRINNDKVNHHLGFN